MWFYLFEMQSPDSTSDEKSNLLVNIISRIHEKWVTEERFKPKTQGQSDTFALTIDTPFAAEVRSFMYIYGDVRDPNWISALTLMRHLRVFLNSLLKRATKIAIMRQDKFLEHESILFLLRKDKAKLQRLLTYLKIKDYKSSISKRYSEVEDIFQDGLRVRTCIQFLSQILTARELNSIREEQVVDLVVQRRIKRNDSRTQLMCTEEYMDFTEQQQCSFLKYGLVCFKNWLMRDNVTSLRATTLVLEIMSFLTREYIGEVIDEVLLQREYQETSSHSSSSSSQEKLNSKHATSSTSDLRLSELKADYQKLINGRFNKDHSIISTIVKSYCNSTSESLNHQDKCTAIISEEIDQAVQKLNMICSPFTIKKSYTKAPAWTAATMLHSSGKNASNVQTASSSVQQRLNDHELNEEDFKPHQLHNSSKLSEKMESGTIIPKSPSPSKPSTSIGGRTKCLNNAVSTRPRRKAAQPERFADFDLT